MPQTLAALSLLYIYPDSFLSSLTMILVDDKQVEALEARRIAEDQDQLNVSERSPPSSEPHHTQKAHGDRSLVR